MAPYEGLRDFKNWNRTPMRASKPWYILDDNYKPKGYDAYVEMMKRKKAQLGECIGYRCGKIRQMIRDGKLLTNHLIRSRSVENIQPLIPRRDRRSTNLNLRDEIDSIRILPIQSNGTKLIQCHKDSDEEISCRQDDFDYKIKLKHKDLSQESLESLIRSLYLRLAASIPKESKKKRSQTEAPTTIPNDAPFMIVLPRAKSSKIKEEEVTTTTEFPLKICRVCDEDETQTYPAIDHMVIECNPRDIGVVCPGEPRGIVSKDITTKQPSAYIYSCKWQGKREVETQNIVVPKGENQSRPSRQSFKIMIDPKEASTNTLSISVAV